MDKAIEAYARGRADGSAGRRDPLLAADGRTGADYRIGFLDARIEIFRVHAEIRRLLDDGRG
jgi:hypothetical protein